MKDITREQLKHGIETDPSIAVVDVLDPESYEDYHLPRAMNVPLDRHFGQTVQQVLPDKSQRIVVYCKDEECTASSLAGEKMEKLGYENVFRYKAGKKDWKQAGLAVES